MDEVSQEKVFDTALKLLSRRAHSVHELTEKLKKKEYPAPAIRFAINECTRLRFLNDEEFARAYYEELAARGYGARRIRQYMFRKGLSEDLIQKHLESEEQEEVAERIDIVLQRKWKSLRRETNPMKKREKAYRYLVSRGFNSSQALTAINNCINREKEESSDDYY